VPNRVLWRKSRRTIENKVESADLNQIKRMENCAIRDVVAQFKMKWRRFSGAIATIKISLVCVWQVS
jgi:hypothetical protein